MKDKILKLIDAYIQDDEALGGKPNYRHNGDAEGIFIDSFNEKTKLYFNRRFHHGETEIYWYTPMYSFGFEDPQIVKESVDVYRLVFSFDKRPPIIIDNKRVKFDFKQTIKAKYFRIKNVFIKRFDEIELNITHEVHLPKYILNCGELSFDIEEYEVKEIYEKIQAAKEDFNKRNSIAELNKRFEKYGIQ